MSYKLISFDNMPLITKKQANEEKLESALAGLAIGIGIGLVLGTTISLLTAPHSGKETRESIKTLGKNRVCDIKEKTANAGEKMTDSVKKAKDRVKEKMESKKEQEVARAENATPAPEPLAENDKAKESRA